MKKTFLSLITTLIWINLSHADYTVQVTHKTGRDKKKHTMKLYFKGSKVRADLPGMYPGAKNTYAICDLKTKKNYYVNPATKTYSNMPRPPIGNKNKYQYIKTNEFIKVGNFKARKYFQKQGKKTIGILGTIPVKQFGMSASDFTRYKEFGDCLSGGKENTNPANDKVFKDQVPIYSKHMGDFENIESTTSLAKKSKLSSKLFRVPKSYTFTKSPQVNPAMMKDIMENMTPEMKEMMKKFK